jgi:hypothetical protein
MQSSMRPPDAELGQFSTFSLTSSSSSSSSCRCGHVMSTRAAMIVNRGNAKTLGVTHPWNSWRTAKRPPVANLCTPIMPMIHTSAPGMRIHGVIWQNSFQLLGPGGSSTKEASVSRMSSMVSISWFLAVRYFVIVAPSFWGMVYY